MDIRILGPLEVRTNAGIGGIGGSRLRTLLILLALDAGRIVTTRRLIAALWGDDPPAGAGNALQSLVSRLRRVLPGIAIESRPTGYRLAVDPDAVDAGRFERLVAVGRALVEAEPARAAQMLREALALWRGPALADVADAEFAQQPIARLAELRLAATEARIEAELALGKGAELVAELTPLVAAHPLRERLRGQFMRALRAAGRQADALATYEEARRVLADELGVDPSRELTEVYLSVLRSAPERTASHGTGAPPSNLPARYSSFIGRGDEVIRVCKLLDETRLVTLTGPGGAGKTRLAIESAAEHAARSPDGVWLVELAPVVDGAGVPEAILAALGLREAAPAGGVPAPPATLAAAPATPAGPVDGPSTGPPGGPAGGLASRVPQDGGPLDRLTGALANRRMLLVLDSCEHVIDAAATAVDRLLVRCPGVRVLATSREPLGIIGETLWPVPPLALPPSTVVRAAEALEYPAVRLFADRTGAVCSSFAVDDSNVADVVRICRELDGMPLAIELAAARMRTLSAAQIADRLHHRFRLLTGGSRTALPRHQTLRAVVDWSWDLLDERERTLLRELSVFSGGATLDAVERVATGEVLEVLASLVDKSLVTVAGREEPRYRLLETIRVYGAERLAATGQEDRVRRAHASYFLERAETADPLLRGREASRWGEALSAEHGNMLAALRWAIDTGEVETAVRLIAALGWHWWFGGYRAETAKWVDEVLALAGDDAAMSGMPTVLMLWALNAIDAGQVPVAAVRDAIGRAVRLAEEIHEEPRYPLLKLGEAFSAMLGSELERALEMLDRHLADPDPWAQAVAHMMRASIRTSQSRAAEAEHDMAAALAGFRTAGEQWCAAWSLTGLAEYASCRGEHDRAIAAINEAVELMTAVNSQEDLPQLLIHRGDVLRRAGELAAARADFEQALRIAEQVRSGDGTALSHRALGDLARHCGDLAEARRFLDRAWELAGGRHAQAFIRTSQGFLAEQEGDAQRGRWLHDEALRHALAAGDGPLLGVALVGRAGVAALTGDMERAALLLGAAERARGVADPYDFDVDRVSRQAVHGLGDDAFRTAFHTGRELSRDEVLDAVGIDR